MLGMLGNKNVPSGSLLYFLAKKEIIHTYAEGRRILRGGGIKIDGQVKKENVTLERGQEVQVGKHKKMIYELDDSD